MLGCCVDFQAMRYEQTSLNRIVDDESIQPMTCVTPALCNLASQT